MYAIMKTGRNSLPHLFCQQQWRQIHESYSLRNIKKHHKVFFTICLPGHNTTLLFTDTMWNVKKKKKNNILWFTENKRNIKNTSFWIWCWQRLCFCTSFNNSLELCRAVFWAEFFEQSFAMRCCLLRCSVMQWHYDHTSKSMLLL